LTNAACIDSNDIEAVNSKFMILYNLVLKITLL